MTTNYALTDKLAVDSGGQKFFALTNITTSQADFALSLGLGACTIGTTSKIHAYQGIATHIAGSPINSAVAGVLGLTAYVANASNAAIANAFPVRGTDRGEVYFTGLSTVTCAMSGSTETFTVTSGLVYRIFAAGCGVVAAGQVSILNGGTSLAHLVFSGANETLPILDFATGTCFGSLRYERRNTVGTVYVSAMYKGWGQG